jgi:predicted transcriptional regulator
MRGEIEMNDETFEILDILISMPEMNTAALAQVWVKRTALDRQLLDALITRMIGAGLLRKVSEIDDYYYMVTPKGFRLYEQENFL